MKQVQIIWTAEEKHRLAGMLRDGLSAGQIAPHFGRSRNAVIGVVHRDEELRKIGFARKPCGVRATNRPVSKLVRTPSPVVNLFSSKPIPITPARPDEKHLAGMPMHMLHAHQCKFAVNAAKPGETHLFCGLRTDGGAWCDFHQHLVYRPTKELTVSRQLEAA